MAADQWYYSKNGQKQGPVNSATLKQLAYSSTLGVNDLVWREGMAEWSPASRVKGLFPEGTIASSPPPLPQSAIAVANAPEANLDQRYNSIYRSSDEKLFLGVAGGLAHKFGLPIGAVRAAVCVSMFFFIGWAYFLGLFFPRLPTRGVPRPA